jgi:hypothetical protein
VSELFATDYYVSEEAVRAAISDHRMFNLFNLSRLVKVDLIVLRDEEFQRHEFARRARRELGGIAAWVISKEDLILSKLVWAAPSESAFQLRDVRKLLASGADEAYLRQWSIRLGVEVLLRKCMDAGYDS